MSRHRPRRTLTRLSLLAALGFGVGCAELEGLLEVPNPATGPDRETIAAGLREALEIGSGRAIDRTAIVDGFLGNELIRIATPSELDSMMRRLRRLGFDRQVDRLEETMNRAAEQAAGEAREVFTAQVRRITWPDAVAILRGGPNAATDYFEERTRDELRARFEPIVIEKMGEVGLTRLYRDLAETYNAIPFVTEPAVDLDTYVTDKALDGLFLVLGEEEAKIRSDPVARTTELLRRVFG